MYYIVLFICIFLFDQGNASQPSERYFFTEMNVIVADNMVSTPASEEALDNMFNEIENTEGLLEMRILREFSDVLNNTSPVNTATITSWTRWSNVDAYVNRPDLFNNQSLPFLSSEFYSVSTDVGGCRYCNSNFEKPVTAHFSNIQSDAVIPVLTTFGIYLLDNTQAEEGTLDYVVTHPVSTEFTLNLIDFDFTRVDFWEMYDTPASFDIHVVNVNDTLVPLAPNWFLGLGSNSTKWFQIQKYSSGCFNCQSSNNNNNDDDNDDVRLEVGHFSAIIILVTFFSGLIGLYIGRYFYSKNNSSSHRDRARDPPRVEITTSNSQHSQPVYGISSNL